MSIESTSIGRIVIPDHLPAGFALFYTTVDFPGRLTDGIAASITALIAQRFGIEATLTTCTQVHGAAVRRAQHEREWQECDSCDALWSATAGTAIAIKVADCLPVTLIDPAARVMANIHSGWRGTVQKITAAALDSIERETSFDPPRAHAWLGPSIRACCFEVGEEVVDQFRAVYADADTFIDRSKAKPHIDTVGLTRALLRERGLADAHIHDTGLCTRCDGSIFHSYRRDGGGGGRNLAIAAM